MEQKLFVDLQCGVVGGTSDGGGLWRPGFEFSLSHGNSVGGENW